MNIKNFLETSSQLPPHIAVLMRGPTGIGKSALVHHLAKNHFKLPFIDARGSTMSEGDVGGYPDLEAMKENGVMTFCLPSWYIKACKEPVVLFLDELNRSLPGVTQSFFQIVLDRCLSNDINGDPIKLHPETRVFSAINSGSEYDVQEMDPALLRRFWVCDLENTKEDWIKWALTNKVDNLMIEFINKNPGHLRVDPSKVEPGTVIPTNASWSRLDECLKYSKTNLIDLIGNKNPALYNLSAGLVGKEAAIEFVDFIRNYKINITAEDILLNYEKVKDKIKELSNDRINTIISHIAENAKDNEWTPKQAENVAEFAKTISEEMLIHLWGLVADCKNIKTITKFHKYIGTYIVDVVNESKTLFKN